MIRSDALLEVRNRLGEETEDFWDDSEELIPYLNEGVRRFSSEERWPWMATERLEVLTAGTSDLELPEGILFPRAFGVLLTPEGITRPYMPTRVPAAKGQELRTIYVTEALYPQWFYQVTTEDEGDAAAQKYIQVMRFIPTPSTDTDVTYLYNRDPVEPVAASDELDVPDAYVRGPIAYATYLAWKKELQGSSHAQAALEEYAYVVSQAKRDVRKDSNDAETGWGNEEPQFRYGQNNDPIGLRLPELLGP
jgi:hypothetical protein